jgi:hypothetical protein
VKDLSTAVGWGFSASGMACRTEVGNRPRTSKKTTWR